MKIAYLVNVYPAPSHAFIRREILALEAAGHDVVRYSVRRFPGLLVDPRDQHEQCKTQVLLSAGTLAIAIALLRIIVSRPRSVSRAMRATWRLALQSRRGMFAHLAYLAEAALLFQWTRRDAVSHIHAHFGTNPAAVAMLCNSLGGPTFSFTIHGPEEFDQPAALGLAEKVAASRFAVAISDFGRSQLYRWASPDCWSELHVIRCGVDADFFSAPTVPVPLAPRLVCVGRLCPEKGQLLLIDAVAQLRSQGTGIELTLIGDGPTRPLIEAHIAQLGVQDSVRLTGFQSSDAIRAAIQGSRALVLPSFAEGLPVVLMEAMSLSRPVVSTYVAGIPELVQPGVNGWLVPAGSTDALVEALREVVSLSPERLQQMGEAGAARVQQNHNAATEAGKLASLFEQCA